MSNKYFPLIMTLGLGLLGACNSGPKVIESEVPAAAEAGQQQAAGGFSFQSADGQPMVAEAGEATVRTIVVKEVLNTARYSYLLVTEGAEEYWVAISKRDIKVGGTYMFQGGLLKKNFFSQEFNRQFETLYLVSNLQEPGGGSEDELDAGFAQLGAADLEVGKITHAQGATRLSDLFANKSKRKFKS
jgi:hypothetical protein